MKKKEKELQEQQSEQQNIAEGAEQNNEQGAEATSEGQQQEAAEEPLEYSADMLLDMTQEEREAFFEIHGKGMQSLNFEKALTEEQLNKKKDSLYELTVELTDTKEEKADVMKDYGDKIKSLETQIGSVTKSIRKGTYDAYESCVKVIDLKNHKVYFFAQDTGQCAKIRDTRDEDLQQVFPFETIYKATDSEGEDIEFIVNRCGGLPELGDEVKNDDGEYELEDGSTITVVDAKITNIVKDDYEDNEAGEAEDETSADEAETPENESKAAEAAIAEDDDDTIPRGNE